MVRALDAKMSVGLLKLERRLNKEWAETLLLEELLWMQKSHVDWLRSGDKNTKFFHTLTLVRRGRNKIEALQSEDGTWINDSEELKNMVV